MDDGKFIDRKCIDCKNAFFAIALLESVAVRDVRYHLQGSKQSKLFFSMGA